MKIAVACTLTTEELRRRKQIVLPKLRTGITERIELPNGYSFTFPGTDAIIDELSEFVKTERECCSFFTFAIIVNGDKSKITLLLTGPEGTKEFIRDELGFL